MLASIPLQTGAIVMATGIVAIGMSRLRVAAISAPLLLVAAAIWVVLLVAVLVRMRVDAAGLSSELSSPSALSVVAATAVLGVAADDLGWLIPAAGLLALAAVLLILVAVPVLRGWRTPTRGVSFLLAVAVASVSVAASALAAAAPAHWLLIPAAVCWGLALVAYLFVIFRFDLRELLRGRGDHWVAGGALAISALAGEELYLRLGAPGQPQEAVVFGLWAAASGWMGMLLLGELTSRRWGYHHLRWATVFPLGMYGVCSLLLSTILNAAPLLTVARVFVWVGFAAWLLVAAGLLARGMTLVRGSARQQPGSG